MIGRRSRDSKEVAKEREGIDSDDRERVWRRNIQSKGADGNNTKATEQEYFAR